MAVPKNSFRDMKSHLGFRPNFHQLEERVQSHMFISVLAYHLMHATECKLRKGGDTRSWKTIKAVLSTHQRITIEYISKTKEGVLMNNEVRLDSRQEQEHYCDAWAIGKGVEPADDGSQNP